VFPAAGHMSVAIEALRQISEENGVQIESVTLRDVDIKTALVIPETEDGIEIQVWLQPIPNSGSGENKAWYSFAVESITDNIWTTHSQGQIAANNVFSNTTHKLEQSPVIVSKLNKQVSGRRWYDAFHTVGFQYGPSFQLLQQVKTNGNDRHAAASLSALTQSGLMTDESRYILHPSTIDACLQLFIISIFAGRHKEMPWGVVPMEMEEVTLWFPGDDKNSPCNAVAWTDSSNGRYFNTNTRLSTKSGKLLLYVKNIRCVAYEAAVPQVLDITRAPEPYMKTDWKPDVTRLTAPENFQISDTADAVLRLIEIIHHKKPLRNVLHLGELSLEFSKSLMAAAAGGQFIFATSNQASLNIFNEDLMERPPISIDLPSDVSLWKDLIPEPQNLVIVDELIVQKYSGDQLFNTIRLLTKESGFLIETVTGSLETSFSKQLSIAGLGTPKFILPLRDAVVVLSSVEVHQNGKVHNQGDFRIISTDPTSIDVCELISVLEAEDISIRSSATTEFEAPSTGTIIVHDSAGTLLSSLDMLVFESLKKVIASGEPLVWLTSGVNQGNNPYGAMAQGFLRAIRSEQASAKITLLDVDVEESPQSIGKVVFEVIESIGTKDSGSETEFWLHDGMTHIPRVVPNRTLNYKVSSGTVATKAFLSDQQHLQGTIEDGKLVFKTAAPPPSKLRESEVEILINAFDFQKDDVQQRKGRWHFAVGGVQQVGEKVQSLTIGQTVVTYTQSAFSTTIRVPEAAVVVVDSSKKIDLVEALGPLSSAMNALVLHGKIQKGEHAVLLPTSSAIVSAAVALSSIFDFDLTVVVEDQSMAKKLAAKHHLSSSVFRRAEDLDEISALFTKLTNKRPRVVVGNEFSALGQEIWRLLPPGGQFILNDGTLTQQPDATPFLKGVSFVATGLETISKQDPSVLAIVIKLATQIFEDNSELFSIDPVMYDIENLGNGKEAVESLAIVEQPGVAVYFYGKSAITVSTSVIIVVSLLTII
jgi:NADPH:quinone reductase-like Zn-dependent oxidoreductase